MNAPTAPSRLKLTLAQYRAMGEHGILPRGLRVELIDGEIIEIADSSLRYDSTTKLSLYARAGVPRYWIVDVRDRSIVEFTRPGGARHLAERRLRAGDRIALGDAGSTLEGLEIDVGEIPG